MCSEGDHLGKAASPKTGTVDCLLIAGAGRGEQTQENEIQVLEKYTKCSAAGLEAGAGNVSDPMSGMGIRRRVRGVASENEEKQKRESNGVSTASSLTHGPQTCLY